MNGIGTRRLLGCVGLVVLAVPAGLASGLFHPLVLGVRGAILALCMSVGGVAASFVYVRRLDAGQPPPFTGVLLCAAVAGVLAGLGVNAYVIDARQLHGDFPAQIVPRGWPVILVCVLFSVVCHAAYWLRWRWMSRRPFLRVHNTTWALALAGFACACVRSVFSPGLPPDIETVLLFGLLSGTCFSLLWLLTLLLCDPAWSLARWQKWSTPRQVANKRSGPENTTPPASA